MNFLRDRAPPVIQSFAAPLPMRDHDPISSSFALGSTTFLERMPRTWATGRLRHRRRTASPAEAGGHPGAGQPARPIVTRGRSTGRPLARRDALPPSGSRTTTHTDTGSGHGHGHGRHSPAGPLSRKGWGVAASPVPERWRCRWGRSPSWSGEGSADATSRPPGARRAGEAVVTRRCRSGAARRPWAWRYRGSRWALARTSCSGEAVSVGTS